MTVPQTADILTARASPGLKGSVALPGDKSVSHRALMLAALAVGETRITGLLEAGDVIRMAEILKALGVTLRRTGPGAWTVWGSGVQGLAAPRDILDFGNSGTGVRLMMGVLAGHPFRTHLTGDNSLCARPMKRVTDPLEQMGAETNLNESGYLPGTLRGGNPLRPITYEVPVPSAQVKSAVLLAGLHAPGRTTVIEAVPTRDHTERMLTRLGAELAIETTTGGKRVITITGQPELVPGPISVPGDPSSAAFPLAAALIAPGSEITIEGMLMNSLRTGLIQTLEEMGAKIERLNERESGGEPIADLRVSAPDGLKGIEVPPERAPSMIDEYPALAIAAANAKGRTVMKGLGELRLKESDRLAALAQGLMACGGKVEEGEDSLTIEGGGPGLLAGGATIEAVHDHRIAMAFLIAGLAAKAPVTVKGARSIATSFPDFTGLMRGLGANLSEETDAA